MTERSMNRNLQRAATRPDDGGEGATLDELYRRHAPWLGAMVRKQFGGRLGAEADDVVQETYARLAPHAAGRIRSPQALLMRIASNLAKDLLRRRAVRGRHVEQSAPAPDCAVGGDALSDLLIKEMILSMPEQYRDVFVLSRFHGMTYEEIATRCGLTIKSVEWRLSRAIAHCVKPVQD